MYHLLHWLYCSIHRKSFLPAWKIQHCHRLTKWDEQMCAAWRMHVSGYELFLLGLPELLAAGFVLLLAVNMSKRSVGVHFIGRECIRKKQKHPIHRISGQRSRPRNLCMCAAKPTASWWAWEVMSEGWYFLGNNLALRSVFSIKLLKEFEHFSSVNVITGITANVIPHLFVDVRVLVHAWTSVQWRCYGSAGIWVTNWSFFTRFFVLSWFWW